MLADVLAATPSCRKGDPAEIEKEMVKGTTREEYQQASCTGPYLNIISHVKSAASRCWLLFVHLTAQVCKYHTHKCM